MTGITDPTEEYFKDGLWGWSVNHWVKIVASAEGVLGMEHHVARCSTAAGQSIPNAAYTIVDFGTVIEDTHSQITTGAAWKFTCKQAGLYLVTTRIMFSNTNTWADSEEAAANLFLSGVLFAICDRRDNFNANAHYVQLHIPIMVRLALGAYIDIRLYQSSGASLALHADASFNSIEIAYVCA